MKCVAGLALLVFTCLSSVFARKAIATVGSNYVYTLYDDLTATLTNTKVNNATTFNVPAYINHEGKQYDLTMIEAYAFKGKTRARINFNSKIRNLLIKKNAFNGILGLKEINVFSTNIDPEIGAFDGIGENTNFLGQGLPNAIERLVVKYLKKWNLPVGKNYSKLSEVEKMKDLANLNKGIDKICHLVTVPYGNTVATSLFTRFGDREGFARLYRIFAIAMGIPKSYILVGSDNYHINLFNYVLVNNNSNGKKWHVLDPFSIYLSEVTESMARSLFKKEKDFIEMISKQRPNNKYLPEKFAIYNNVYNFEGETGYTGTKAERFNDYIARTRAPPRTL